MDTDNLWNTCLQTIKADLSTPVFNTWFSNTKITHLEEKGGETLVEIACPSFFVKSQIEQKYKATINDLLATKLSTRINAVFSVAENWNVVGVKKEETSPLFKSMENNREAYENALKNAHVRAFFTFENFAVSGSNQMAYAAAQAVAEKIGSAYNPLFIWGGVGVGKTHLMSAVGCDLLTKNHNKKVLFCTGEEFTNDIVEGIRHKTTQIFRNRYRKLDLLMLDDVQFIAGKEGVQEEFFHTFNAIVGSGGQVVLTSDRPPHEISKLEERLKSRFEAGLIVDIAPPDFELRCAIVAIKAKEMGLDLATNIISVIAANVDSARKIQGVLTKIKTEIIFKKTVLDENNITNIIAHDKNEIEAKRVTVKPEDIVVSVSKHFDVNKRDLLGHSRVQKFVKPRQVLMYFLRIEQKLALDEVGALIGGRDHTTIMHGVEKITHLATTSVDIREDISGIKKLLWG